MFFTCFNRTRTRYNDHDNVLTMVLTRVTRRVERPRTSAIRPPRPAGPPCRNGKRKAVTGRQPAPVKEQAQNGTRWISFACSSSSYFINNRQPNGSLSNVLSRLAVGVRVVGDGGDTMEGARTGRRPGGDTPQGASLRALRVQIEIEENKRERGIGDEKEGA